MHVAGVNADPSTFEHIDPSAVGNAREVLVSELSGKGTVHRARAAASLDDAIAARVVERVKELEHRGFQFEAADGSFELLIRRETGEYEPLFRLESWRVIAEKRDDGRVETEATIKIWVDGERYVRTAEGNGPVHALDRALRARDRRAPPAPARHQARQLQGPHPRRVEGDRRDHARAARRLRRHATLGRDRRARERHRGVAGTRWSTRWRRACCRPQPQRAPARGRDPARPRRSSASPRSRRRARGAALGPALARARACRRSRARSRRASARRTRARCRRGTAGAAPGAARRRGRGRATRSSRRRSRSSPRANSILFERATPVFVDIDPVTLEPRPGRGRGRDHAAHDARCCRCTSSATRPTCRRSSATGCRSSRTPARRSARCTPTARRSAAAAIPRRSASTPTSSSPPARAGCSRSARPSTRSASTPSATRAARRTWAGSTTTGSASTTGSPTSRARSGWPSCERLDDMLAARARVARLVPRGAGRLRGPRAAVRGLRRRRARLVRVRRPAPARRRPRRHDPRAARARRAVQAVPARDPPDVLLPRALRPPRAASSRSARTSPRARSRCRSSRS